jgi:hypothetical protein
MIFELVDIPYYMSDLAARSLVELSCHYVMVLFQLHWPYLAEVFEIFVSWPKGDFACFPGFQQVSNLLNFSFFNKNIINPSYFKDSSIYEYLLP